MYANIVHTSLYTIQRSLVFNTYDTTYAQNADGQIMPECLLTLSWLTLFAFCGFAMPVSHLLLFYYTDDTDLQPDRTRCENPRYSIRYRPERTCMNTFLLQILIDIFHTVVCFFK